MPAFEADSTDPNLPGLTGKGPGHGVWGESTQNGTGVVGKCLGGSGIGVYGESTNAEGVLGVGHKGAGVSGTSVQWVGVYGSSTNGDGVNGVSNTADKSGVVGINKHATTDIANGVLGICTTNLGGSGAGNAIHGIGGTNAGLFDGHVQINGGLDVTGAFQSPQKHFVIDHPCDPANKYLYHSSVESPEMMNMYNGNINTDGNGEAAVILPDYFEALNCDFRYQLTPIGQFSQAIVAKEIAGNRFSIRTDKPNVKVSWQVSGVRKDVYARANPITVEQEKSAGEKGFYLHPQLYGQPFEKGLTGARSRVTPRAA